MSLLAFPAESSRGEVVRHRDYRSLPTQLVLCRESRAEHSAVPHLFSCGPDSCTEAPSKPQLAQHLCGLTADQSLSSNALMAVGGRNAVLSSIT